MSVISIDSIRNQIEFISTTESGASVTNETVAEIFGFLLSQIEEYQSAINTQNNTITEQGKSITILRNTLEGLQRGLTEMSRELSTIREMSDKFKNLLGDSFEAGLQLPTIDIDNLDTMGTDGSRKAMLALIENNWASRYVLIQKLGTSKPVNVGVLDLLSDSSSHTLTQVLTTHNILKSDGTLDKTAHSDIRLLHVFRTYRLSSGGSWGDDGPAQYQWSKWKALGATTEADELRQNTAISELQDEVWPLVVTGTPLPATVLVGETTSVAVAIAVSRKGVAVPVSEWTRAKLNGVDIAPGNSSVSINVTSSQPTTKGYILEVTTGGRTAETTVNVKVVHPTYSGAVASGWSATESSVKALSRSAQESKSGKRTGISLSSQKYVYAYPASYGSLTSVIDGNSVQMIDSYTKSTVSIEGIQYFVYVLSQPQTKTNFSQTFA